MKKRRKATRPAPVLNLSARLVLLISPKRQASIRPAFEPPREFVLLSVRALALRLGTDPAITVVLLGGDALVKFLEHLLIVLELPVTSATSPAEVVHKVRMLGKRDLMIAVSYGRGLRQTVEGWRQARTNATHCIGITDTLVSTIGEFAHESFLTSIETPSFGSSYVAPMALFNVIVVASANHRRGRTLSLMKRVEQEPRHGFRWYES